MSALASLLVSLTSGDGVQLQSSTPLHADGAGSQAGGAAVYVHRVFTLEMVCLRRLVSCCCGHGSVLRHELEPLSTRPSPVSCLREGTSTVSQHSDVGKFTHMNARRKARTLSRHRSAIARWTEEPSHDARFQKPSSKSAAIEKASPGCTNNDSRKTDAIRHDLLCLTSAKTLGRHFVASSAIPPGTVLITEQPFAWCIDRAHATDSCAHCLFEVRLKKQVTS